ncbi:hypothetical protein BABINDRAFT_162833 [Babjeviella inositovora NRRL Y-12698]|uniref:Uncharacterized protein n=1 Tax=Babjeviella inositovora NRRL Y-12698 TaxID=984486 RepID=A0A1E3QKI1_9ASCO|nr:uncharacterized protein BABINDRAFT_162833 [Babjeviella inositovora NRRL Y-12698]ODQ78160.1 hypothetical protein BABINDRAFT_162833 [Babjeviella inositovora NRRL Y-12698]
MSGKLALHRNPLALQRVYSEYPLTNSVDLKLLREIRTRNRPETWLSVVNLNITHYLGVGYTLATFQADDHVYRVPQTWIKEHNTLVMNIIKELLNNPQETTISSLETLLHLLVDYLDQDKAIIATSQIFGHPEMSPVEKARKLQMRMQLYEVILMCYNMLVISINGEGSGAHMPHGEERERLYRYYGLKCVKYALCSLAIYRQFLEFLRLSGEPKHAIRCFLTIQLESLVPRALLTLISYLVRSTWTDQSSLQRLWRKDVFTSFTLDRLENGSEHDEPSLKASSEPLESLLADRGCLLEYGKMIVQRCQDAEEPCLIQISWAVPVFQALELRLELFMQLLEEQRRQTSHLNGTFTAAERVPGITLQGLQDDNLPQSYSPRAFSSTQVKMKESLPAFQAQPTQSSLIGRPSSGYYPTVYFPHSEGVPIHFQRATIEQAYPPARELQQTIYHPFGTYLPHINPHAISQAPTPFDPSFILPNQYMPYYLSYTAQSSQQADFHVFTQPPPLYSNPTSQRPNTEAFFGDPRNAPNQQNRWDV